MPVHGINLTASRPHRCFQALCAKREKPHYRSSVAGKNLTGVNETRNHDKPQESLRKKGRPLEPILKY